MSRERNKTHKKNRRKKEFEFWNCKAAFIGGITAIMGCINEIVSICTKIPIVIYLMEVMSVLMLFYYALGTKKLDKVLRKKRVEKFGSFLTVFSVVYFLLGRMLISSVENVEFEYNWINEKMWVVIILSVVFITGIIGAIYLLTYNYTEK